MQEIAILERREELIKLIGEELACLRTYQKEIQEVYRLDEIIWCQQARSKWLKKGDTNTAYFHRIANMRHGINAIHSLTTLRGAL